MITKDIKKYMMAGLVVCGFSACASEFDNDYQVAKPAVVTQAEQLNSYGTILEYIDPAFHMGNTLSSAEFLGQATPFSLTCSNFNELTISDAFLHNKLVAADGTIDSTSMLSVIDLASQADISLYGESLLSSTNIKDGYLINLLPGKNAEAFKLCDFEDKELGFKYPLALNGGAASGTAEVVDDPDGESGHCLHVACGLMFPVISIQLPAGHKFGEFTRIEMDWRAVNDGGLAGFANAFHVRLNNGGGGDAVDFDTPASQGCKKGEWGRGKVVLDLSKFNLTAAQQDLTSVDLEMGPVDWWCEYYVDNIKLIYEYNEPDYESAEARSIASGQAKKYVQTLLKHYGNAIPAWTIADRPVSSPSDMFWKHTMGEAYFGEAARYARQQKSDITLFVSEEGLTDASRLEALISLINQEEKEGAKIDGIDAIVSLEEAEAAALEGMFKTLAATGKQIRLSGLGATKDADADAAALKTVIAKYMQAVPAAQRYGISFAKGTSTLWDSHYDRMPAYAGMIDNLR